MEKNGASKRKRGDEEEEEGSEKCPRPEREIKKEKMKTKKARGTVGDVAEGGKHTFTVQFGQWGLVPRYWHCWSKVGLIFMTANFQQLFTSSAFAHLA